MNTRPQATRARRPKRWILRHCLSRPVIQWVFLALVLAIGRQFTLFVWQLEQGFEPTLPRPPAVEAFLPISALISLKYWVLTYD